MDRLARNLDDLRAIVRTLTARGVQVEFVKDQLIFTGSTPRWRTRCCRSWARSPSSNGH